MTNLQRYLKYGMTEAAVRKNLVPIVFMGRRFLVHRKVKPALLRVEARILNYEKEKGVKHPWRPAVAQCFNWRLIHGSKSRSLHSWAIAIDFDPAKNPQGTHTTNIPSYVRAAFRINDFRWGGDFKGVPDTMHMEYTK